MWSITEDDGKHVVTCNGNFVGSFNTLGGAAMFLERHERRIMMENAPQEERVAWIISKADDNRRFK